MAAVDPTSRAFGTTQWSLVAAVGDHDPEVARASLVILCLRYWYPVHAYLRRSGHDPQGAHALALAFFRHLVRVDMARTTARRQGRFRQFLLAELHRYLSAPGGPADGRTGDLPAPALAELEARLCADAAPGQSPEQLLHRGFALEVLAGALERLRGEAADAGRAAMFDALAPFLGSPPAPGDYEQVAAELAMRPVQVAMAVRRLRQRFRELVDAELCDTLVDPGQLDAEREALMQVLTDVPP